MLYWKEITMKNISELEARKLLSSRGHKNIVTVTFPSGHTIDTHEHPFDADFVIISGNMKLKVADKEYNLTPGNEFQLGAGIKHSELMGEDGVILVSARPEVTDH